MLDSLKDGNVCLSSTLVQTEISYIHCVDLQKTT